MVSVPEITREKARSLLGLAVGSVFPFFLEVHEPGLGGDRRTHETVNFGTSIPAKSTTFSGLKQNTRYALTLHTRSNNSNRHTAARVCFKTATDLTRAIQDWGEDNFADSGTAGRCFAFGGTRQQILACLSGARNGNSWARNDSQDGYSYIVPDSTWRNQVGRSTN